MSKLFAALLFCLLLPTFNVRAAEEDQRFFCDSIVDVPFTDSVMISHFIEDKLKQTFPGARVCQEGGGWSSHRWISLQIVDLGDREAYACFDMTRSWGEVQKKLNQVWNKQKPAAEPATPRAAAPVSECSNGETLDKPVPREAADMKEAWLKSGFPDYKLLSRSLVRQGDLHFIRIQFSAEGKAQEVCVNVQQGLSPCGNRLDQLAAPPPARRAMPRDTLLLLNGQLTFIDGPAAAKVEPSEPQLNFPKRLAGLPRGPRTDFEARSPGLGFGWRYQRSGIKADIYVYNKQTTPADGDAAAQEAERDAALAEIGRLVQAGIYQGSTVQEQASRAIAGVGFATARIAIKQRGTNRDSFLYVAIIGGNYVKVRLTMPKRASSTETADGFVGQFVAAQKR